MPTATDTKTVGQMIHEMESAFAALAVGLRRVRKAALATKRAAWNGVKLYIELHGKHTEALRDHLANVLHYERASCFDLYLADVMRPLTMLGVDQRDFLRAVYDGLTFEQWLERPMTIRVRSKASKAEAAKAGNGTEPTEPSATATPEARAEYYKAVAASRLAKIDQLTEEVRQLRAALTSAEHRATAAERRLARVERILHNASKAE